MAKLIRFSFSTRPENLRTKLELKREGLVPGAKAVGFFGGAPCFNTLLYDRAQAVKADAMARAGAAKPTACLHCGMSATRGRNLKRGGLCPACYAKRQMEVHFPGHLSLYRKATAFYGKATRKSPDLIMEECKALLSGPTLFLDTEATGARTAEIVEIGLVDPRGRTVYHSLIHANHPCNPVAYALHHISDDELALAPDFDTVWPEIKELLLSHTIVIFDAPSDLSFLAQTLAANGIIDGDLDALDIRCAMRMYRDYCQATDGIGLQRACYQMGFDMEQNHRVIGDCVMTLSLLERMSAGIQPLRDVEQAEDARDTEEEIAQAEAIPAMG